MATVDHQVKIGNYLLGDTIGSGTFGKVKEGIHQLTKHKVAVKIVNRNKIKTLDVAAKLRREIQNLRLFRHPHIIKLYQVISTPTDIFMVMEYVSGGEIFDYIVKRGRLSENEARKFFQQIISGVAYCHQNMVVHRDLKPENLLLDLHGNVKIADFGLSNIMTDGEFLQTSCGSPNYAAPEVISGQFYAGPEVDVWSSGVILYALLCGALPFDDDNIPNLFKKIRHGVFSTPDYLSASVCELLHQMLMVDPVRRATVQQIQEHPWYQQDLPDYLRATHWEQDASVIDKAAVAELCEQADVEERDVYRALLCGDPHDQLAVAYRLLTDEKIERQPRDGERRAQQVHDFYLASSPVILSSLSNPFSTDQSRSSSLEASRLHRHPERMPDGLDVTRALNTPAHNVPGQGANMKRFRWHLGIRSQSQPQDIMHEVYKAMALNEMEWKTVNAFQVRARRWMPHSMRYCKISLQLYAVDARSYLLDFKALPPLLGTTSTDCSSELEKLPSTDITEVANNPQLHCGSTLIEFMELCGKLICTLAQ